MVNSTAPAGVKRVNQMTYSPEDQQWFAQITALTRREITIEEILGPVGIFKKCECGVELLTNASHICPECAKQKLIQYSKESMERIRLIPLVRCPGCEQARYTKLCVNGICCDCNDIDERKKDNARYNKAKPKSLRDKVGSFIEHSQPREKETEIVPF